MNQNKTIVEKKYVLPFILVTSLFALWGFANDLTNPMVAAFQTVMEISAKRASLIQFAFYGGYATMAIPAALFIRKFGYKKGILLGLALYAVGALLFYPAAQFEIYIFFLLSLYILTFGLAFLETTANPYILSMGSSETATRRLNLAQAFNPLGSITGMFVATNVILSALDSEKVKNFETLDLATKATYRTHDLGIIKMPYITIGFVVLIMLLIIAIAKMPNGNKRVYESSAMTTYKRLLKNKRYVEGVFAQAFYVGAQIMCWTFIIHYGENLGLSKATAQNYNIVAMAIFIASRFLSTFLMKFINSRKLLTIFAIGGIISLSGVIFIQGMAGMYCLVATSAFMSLMFPTIYGIALNGLGEDATLASAGLILAIVGGAVMPPLQAILIDMEKVAGLPGVNASFILPLICFVVIGIYGYRSLKDMSPA
ncbi:L-fucose:H+ symporter permease [Sunxiuqinia sp. A32]|uniref:L-fucose:H+ symporter permease n=1 Tax=Sunxiuqinia sp. A32 TaxID=3461496 RepID=UPI004045FF78